MRALTFVISIIVCSIITQPAVGESLTLPTEIQNYQSWESYKNMPLPELLSTLCYLPPIQSAYLTYQRQDKGPHKSKFVSVFFNSTAQKVQANSNEVKFPRGSIIVKEKKITKESVPIELGVMIKTSDSSWEYFFVNSDNQIVRGPKATEACAKCHDGARQTDFVFGNYRNIN